MGFTFVIQSSAAGDKPLTVTVQYAAGGVLYSFGGLPPMLVKLSQLAICGWAIVGYLGVDPSAIATLSDRDFLQYVGELLYALDYDLDRIVNDFVDDFVTG